MREDPLISGGIVKFLLAAMLLGGVGFGGYQLVKDIDLDDGSTTTEFSDTTLEDTTIGDPEPVPEQPVGPAGGEQVEPFTTAGLAAAIAALLDAEGAATRLTQIVVNDVQVQFVVWKGGEEFLAYTYLQSGAFQQASATVSVSGNATIKDFAFPLSVIKPAFMGRLVDGARKLSRDPEYRPTVFTLERALPSGRRDLEWRLNGEANGRYVLYRARANGTGMKNEGGAGTPIPEAALKARRLNECIERAEGNPDEISACFSEFE